MYWNMNEKVKKQTKNSICDRRIVNWSFEDLGSSFRAGIDHKALGKSL